MNCCLAFVGTTCPHLVHRHYCANAFQSPLNHHHHHRLARLTTMARKGKAPEATPLKATEPTPTQLSHTSSEPAATTEAQSASEPSPSSSASTRTLADRQAMFERLKQAKNQAGQANARALVQAERQKTNNPSRPTEYRARKLANAQTELERMDAQARGDDPERVAHWHYSIEETEKWNAKLDNKAERKDQGAVDHTTEAERAYARKIRALPHQDGKKNHNVHHLATVGASTGSSAHVTDGLAAADDDLDAVPQPNPQEEHYGSHNPSNDAVDAVVKHMSTEAATRASRSRKRAVDPDAEITYINERNKAFNDRVSRFYDRYTKDIKDNLERGTAL